MVPNSKARQPIRGHGHFSKASGRGQMYPIMGPRTSRALARLDHIRWRARLRRRKRLTSDRHCARCQSIRPSKFRAQARSSDHRHPGWVWRGEGIARLPRPMPSSTSARCIGRRTASAAVRALRSGNDVTGAFCIYEAPITEACRHSAITLSRSADSTGPNARRSDVKGFLSSTPNCSRALIEAVRSRGFQNLA